MAQHNTAGKEGEALAAAYFRKKGYDILHQNWRYSRYEIDLIALHHTTLHFIEVKLRNSKSFGMPEEKVTPKKFRFLSLAADEFLNQHPQYKYIQFDILSINKTGFDEPEYFLIEDIYF
jgi:putative endonuclease